MCHPYNPVTEPVTVAFDRNATPVRVGTEVEKTICGTTHRGVVAEVHVGNQILVEWRPDKYSSEYRKSMWNASEVVKKQVPVGSELPTVSEVTPPQKEEDVDTHILSVRKSLQDLIVEIHQMGQMFSAIEDHARSMKVNAALVEQSVMNLIPQLPSSVNPDQEFSINLPKAGEVESYLDEQFPGWKDYGTLVNYQ